MRFLYPERKKEDVDTTLNEIVTKLKRKIQKERDALKKGATNPQKQAGDGATPLEQQRKAEDAKYFQDKEVSERKRKAEDAEYWRNKISNSLNNKQ